MGTVYNRGTRAKPNWYVAYEENGRRVSKRSRQPTKAQARKYLEQIEARIASGLVGVPEPSEDPTCEDLMTRWSEGLRNRNVKDDQSRLRRHLLPEFGERKISSVTLAVVMEWIDKQRAAGTLSDASIRHNLNLLREPVGNGPRQAETRTDLVPGHPPQPCQPPTRSRRVPRRNTRAPSAWAPQRGMNTSSAANKMLHTIPVDS